jgi:hypothetical protein
MRMSENETHLRAYLAPKERTRFDAIFDPSGTMCIDAQIFLKSSSRLNYYPEKRFSYGSIGYANHYAA